MSAWVLCVLHGVALAQAAMANPAVDVEQTHRLVVKYRTATSESLQAVQARVERVHGARERPMSVLRTTAGGAYVYDLGKPVPLDEARALAMTVAASDAVEYAAPDVRVRAMSGRWIPNDPYLPYQWALVSPGAIPGGANFFQAWTRSTGQHTTVAVVDTGYVPHPDLSVNEYAGYDFVSDPGMANDGQGRDADPSDPGDYCDDPVLPSTWHGLKVASQIAALADNGVGIAGAAPGAKVLQVRAIGRCTGWLSDIADAVSWAVGGVPSGPGPRPPANGTPVQVVNLSLRSAAGTPCFRYIEDAVNLAWRRNVTVVVAAGNDASTGSAAPANCPGVIAVGAHTASGDLASDSNRSTAVTLTAPAGGACARQTADCLKERTASLGNAGTSSPARNLDFAHLGGTSSAAAYVSSAVALMLSANPALTPAQVKATLVATAREHPSNTYCAAQRQACGAGMLDAAQAVAATSQPVLSLSVPAGPIGGSSGVAMSVASTGLAPFTYRWTQLGGPAVVLSGADTATVRFTAPATRAQVTLQVVVTSGNGLSAGGRASVQVNNAPLVVPGRFRHVAGQGFQRALSVVEPDGDAVIAALLDGPPGARLSGNVLVWENPTLGTATFRLQAEDTSGQRGPVSDVTVDVLSPDAYAAEQDADGGGGSMSAASLLGLLLAIMVCGARRGAAGSPSPGRRRRAGGPYHATT